MISTTRNRKGKVRIWAIAAWMIIWQLASMGIGQEILLVSPVTVLQRLFALIPTGEFWHIISFSFFRIMGGFLLAAVCGVILAGIAVRFEVIEEFIRPFVFTIKSIPVASFVILVLIWIPSKNLSVIISFLMVFPIIYTNVLEGQKQMDEKLLEMADVVILVLIWIPSKNLSVIISFLMVFPIIYTNVLEGQKQMDEKLLEMADVFSLSRFVRIRYIYLSQILPYFRAGCSVALGLCWKAGVAAEVIGIPDYSIGEQLYQAKVYLNTPDLFAWTVVIVILSVLFESVFLYVIDQIVHWVEK